MKEFKSFETPNYSEIKSVDDLLILYECNQKEKETLVSMIGTLQGFSLREINQLMQVTLIACETLCTISLKSEKKRECEP